ncbi:MAG TPA: hypothetical protein DCP91_02975, partial [Eggerthellaceae bacterium]|nr:hypothetical protein [Eggerthellaceae bacterium]
MNGMKHERMRASQRVPFRVGAGAGAAAAAVGREGRSRRGFTMMELITVIAILGIMMAIVFVSVSRIQKDMQQLELDGTAKEIFIAAQNHLATAESQGLIDSKTEFGSHDSRATKSNDEETNNSDDVYYYVVNSASKRYLNSATNDSKTSVLYQMLPFGSIDETVRMGGTYVIQYDRESATVLGVFYANTALGGFPFNRADGFEFQDDDYAQLFPGMTGQAQKSARQDYASASGVTVMVGYYGGEDRESLKGESLNQPRLEILNGDCLVAKIVLPDTSSSFLRDEEPTMKLLVSGDTSGAEKDFTLINKGDYLTATQVDYIQGGEESGDQVFYVYLDDVTWKGGHFSELFDGFIPGENLTLQAVAFSTTRLTNVARSAKGHCNSLFGQLMQSQPASSDDQAEGVAYDKATVASLRHFANMDTDISGYDPDAQEWADKSTAVPKAFDQTVDLSWSTFRDNVVLEPKELFASASLSLGTQSADSLLAQAVAESAEQVRVCAAGEDYVVDEGSFMPVSPSTYSLTYNGGSHRISDVVVKMSSSGDAGLFGALDDDVASDLTLLNFRVSTPNGNAGALAASMSGASRASGVLAYNAADDDREYEVVASGNAGGLVGELHAASMENCAASLYVRSTGASAGGLVGVADNAASVGGSYAGAHTYERAFRETADKEAGHYNVDASGNAGGL